MSYYTTNNFSSFWSDYRDTSSVDELLGIEEKKHAGRDLIALASYRRAISNFVNIVSGKSIPVEFNSKDQSYTDGKKVVIGANLNDKNFDVAVGLALHEGSHNLLSDFELLNNLHAHIPAETYTKAQILKIDRATVDVHIKRILNYIEDRRIDHYIFRTSPGYKGYYHSMYDKYFHFKAIDKGLKSSEYTEETIDSYFFRIINLTNSNTNLDALKGLRDIWKILDLRNIGRLSSIEKTFKVATDIYDVILNNISEGTEKVDSETGEVSYERTDGGGDKKNSESTVTISDDDFGKLLDSIEKGEMDTSGGDSDEGEVVSTGPSIKDEGSDEVEVKNTEVELTENQKKQLENAIKKQKKFMDGEVTKTNVTKKDKKALDVVEESGMEYREVAKDLTTIWKDKLTPTKVIVVNNLTKKLIDSDTVRMVNEWNGRGYDGESYHGSKDTYIEDGIRLGTILGRKLQIRGETRETKYTRKLKGRIDKRLIAELGFDNENVFSQTFMDSYPDAFLHISVDASGSLSGDKWDKTMPFVEARAKGIVRIPM